MVIPLTLIETEADCLITLMESLTPAEWAALPPGRADYVQVICAELTAKLTSVRQRDNNEFHSALLLMDWDVLRRIDTAREMIRIARIEAANPHPWHEARTKGDARA
jgi:hypothetical protein